MRVLGASRVTLLVGAIAGLAAGVSAAEPDGASTYASRCASCHGGDGKAETPVGRALKIPSFSGKTFMADEVGTLLRESKSHASIDLQLDEAGLAALVATLNALASAE